MDSAQQPPRDPLGFLFRVAGRNRGFPVVFEAFVALAAGSLHPDSFSRLIQQVGALVEPVGIAEIRCRRCRTTGEAVVEFHVLLGLAQVRGNPGGDIALPLNLLARFCQRSEEPGSVDLQGMRRGVVITRVDANLQVVFSKGNEDTAGIPQGVDRPVTQVDLPGLFTQIGQRLDHLPLDLARGHRRLDGQNSLHPVPDPVVDIIAKIGTRAAGGILVRNSGKFGLLSLDLLIKPLDLCPPTAVDRPALCTPL